MYILTSRFDIYNQQRLVSSSLFLLVHTAINTLLCTNHVFLFDTADLVKLSC